MNAAVRGAFRSDPLDGVVGSIVSGYDILYHLSVGAPMIAVSVAVEPCL